MNKPRRLSGIIKNISDPVFGKKSMLYGQLIANWNAVVGDETASYAVPAELKFKRTQGKQNTAVLILAVTSARAQDVLMQKSLLIEKLNQFMGFMAIEDIQLTHRPHRQIRQNPAFVHPKRTLSPHENNDIQTRVSAVENEDLKKALAALGTAVYSRQIVTDPLKTKEDQI